MQVWKIIVYKNTNHKNKKFLQRDECKKTIFTTYDSFKPKEKGN